MALVESSNAVERTIIGDVWSDETYKEPIVDIQHLDGFDGSSGNSNLLIASPYESLSHLLDLDTLEIQHQLFAKALTNLQAVRSDYTTAPYDVSFNWDAVVDSYRQSIAAANVQAEVPSEQSFFVIVFRSQLKEGADKERLGQHDELAHEEAVVSGGLLKYWFGVAGTDRRNLATCLWRSRNEARSGGTGPGHVAAMQFARRSYDEWFVQMLRLTVDTISGKWTFSEWVD
ncbi:hypothetical protein K431DRAFT_301484 [Polychaeton citri CBS 116435]|uniref:Uncharacterized protein n=1 Tax=Polychaeton citri CBS 116435 TaxID=1314669 RepID=A0A9P4QEX0_9PEZI|nr:hypothetical protein K431DRAFT_301484 [Polychaeton citri CBS 116435]